MSATTVECMFVGKLVEVPEHGECPECDLSIDDDGFWDAHDDDVERVR